MKMRFLSKWCALYIWEPTVNKDLLPYDMYFDQLICIKKSDICPLIFSAYFTVKRYENARDDVKFCQYIVQFDDVGRFKKRCVMTWREVEKGLITTIKKENLVLDNRKDFDWLNSPRSE